MSVENTSRTALLERVRGAFTKDGGDATVTHLQDHRRRRAVRPGVVELFVERVEECEATVRRIRPDQVESTLADVLELRRTAVPRGFPWAVPKPVRDEWLGSEDLDDVPAAATTVTLAVATTGTLVMTHGEGQGRRLLTSTPDLHVAVVLEDQVVFGVPDAVAALDPHRAQTWVSGPSAPVPLDPAAAESERQLVVLLVSR